MGHFPYRATTLGCRLSTVVLTSAMSTTTAMPTTTTRPTLMSFARFRVIVLCVGKMPTRITGKGEMSRRKAYIY